MFDIDLDCEFHRRGETGYGLALADAVWNARKPRRSPDLIVLAEHEDDVRATVRYARVHGLKIGVRSGGHSWIGAHVRDGGILLDLSRLRDVRVDPDRRTATIQPGVIVSELNRELVEHGLFFPVGHGPDVGLAGFLMGGGYGWNSRHLGPACLSIDAVDVVTADGELVHATDGRNADLLWAARGCGPGFFGVVTRFYLRLYEQPGTIARSTQVYPVERCAEVVRWSMEIAPALPTNAEFVVMVTPPPISGHEGAAVIVSLTAFADSPADAAKILAPMEECPLLGAALLHGVAVPSTLAELGTEVERETPKGRRYVCDNLWTHAGPDAMAPLVQRAVDTMPNAESQVFWYYWGADQAPGNACWSSQAPWYFAVYGIGTDPAADASHAAWVSDTVAAALPHSSGTQFADADTVARFDRPISEFAQARLERLRATYDPTGVFHGYLTGDSPS